MWLFYEQPEIDFRDLVQKFMDIHKRAASIMNGRKRSTSVSQQLQVQLE